MITQLCGLSIPFQLCDVEYLKSAPSACQGQPFMSSWAWMVVEVDTVKIAQIIGQREEQVLVLAIKGLYIAKTIVSSKLYGHKGA